ncbi:MAG TPA: signal peptidase I, partial [Firmicutes bacterium]|nr:signal peptidase I [Bacillota bacterium]
ISAFQRFSPILPDLNWLAHGFVSIFLLASSLSLLEQLYRAEVLRKRSREKENYLGWIAASIVSVLLVWFAVGVFDLFPTVVLTGSMSPCIEPGDIVIVRRVSPAEITVDDVIQFREENMKVIHRVVSLQEENNNLFFVTKGDANERADAAPVTGDRVMGKVVKVIPKIGRITMRLRGAI